MLIRQRVLLELLRSAKRPLVRVELVKWAFRLRHETRSGGGPSFYDFVPHRRGPYSFTLRRELQQLVEAGWVKEVADTWEATRASTSPIPPPVSSDIATVVSRSQALDENELLAAVYDAHPLFTVNSESRRLLARPVAPAAVYTVGYEGVLVERLLFTLVTSGIRRLIDVRHNPTARRYGFHRGTLTDLCGQVGIEYVSVPELGIPSANRAGLGECVSHDDLFRWYTETRLTTQAEHVRRVAELVTGEASTLMCMEAEACRCHRSRLAERVAELCGLPVTHLTHAS